MLAASRRNTAYIAVAVFMMAIISTSLTVSLPAYAQNYTVPAWVKKNAKWWHEGSVDDKDFVQGIQYLIQKGIMKIPETKSSDSKSSQKIPPWVKNNAGWWADGKISDVDFVSGIQYLISHGIMKIGPPPTPSKEKCTGYYC